MQNDSLAEFYATAGPYTEPTVYRERLRRIGADYERAVSFVARLIIHPIEAKRAGVRGNYRSILRDHVFHRTVDDIFQNASISNILDEYPDDETPPIDQRAILSCDHVALSVISILRLSGLAIRMRAGFALHIIPDTPVAHWLCERYDRTERSWILSDPERKVPVLPPEKWVSGSRAWLLGRAGELDTDQLTMSSRTGNNALKFALLADSNCLMKHELLTYDWMITRSGQQKPPLYSKPYSALTDEELELLDSLALGCFSVDVDRNSLTILWQNIVKPENRRPA